MRDVTVKLVMSVIMNVPAYHNMSIEFAKINKND